DYKSVALPTELSRQWFLKKNKMPQQYPSEPGANINEIRYFFNKINVNICKYTHMFLLFQ
ncbi:hypothetical protein U9029_25115, partial [Escherichia coli]